MGGAKAGAGRQGGGGGRWPWLSLKREGPFPTSDILNHAQTWRISKAEEKISSQGLSEPRYLVRLVCTILAMGTGLSITGEGPRALTGKLGHLWGCLWNLALGSDLPLPSSFPFHLCVLLPSFHFVFQATCSHISFVLDQTLCRAYEWAWVYFADSWLGTRGRYLPFSFQRNICKYKVEDGLPRQEVEFSHNNICFLNGKQSLMVVLEIDPSSPHCHSEHLSVSSGLPLGLLSDSNVNVFGE